jgi:hypothetical protein
MFDTYLIQRLTLAGSLTKFQLALVNFGSTRSDRKQARLPPRRPVGFLLLSITWPMWLQDVRCGTLRLALSRNWKGRGR